MLCLLVYFLDHLWMTSILFDVNMYCRFFSILRLVNWVMSVFSISRLVNWVTSDPLKHKGLKIWKFSHVVHMLVGWLLTCWMWFCRKDFKVLSKHLLRCKNRLQQNQHTVTEPINVSNNIIEMPSLFIANFNNTIEQTNDPPANRDDNNSFSKKQKNENCYNTLDKWNRHGIEENGSLIKCSI